MFFLCKPDIFHILNCVFLTQMAEVSADAVTLDLLREARETVRSSPLGVINTPMIPWCHTTLPLDTHCNIHIKLENMQRTGQRKPLCLTRPCRRQVMAHHLKVVLTSD